MKLFDQIWQFFASVKLAIFTLIAIALTSILGTIIPQGEPYALYVKKYGQKMALFFQVLDIPTMYGSWWFLGLLGVLSANLIICSLDRFPTVWRIITTDNLSLSTDRLHKMPSVKKWQVANTQADGIDWHAVLQQNGWPSTTKKTAEGELYFSQKSRWGRTGVYIVHTSVLIIFLGAIIGHFFGFKGNVMIPETRSTEKVFTQKTSTPIELGFTVRCDSFNIEFYQNGMPKEYKSILTLLENGKEILKKDIKVNSPLTYKGITFYQSSYQGYQEFIFNITETATGEAKQFSIPFQQQMTWDDKGLRFGIINAEAIGQRAVRAKVWFKAGDDPAITQWLVDNERVTLKSGEKTFTIQAKQMYATGLQVAKDPGVWVVYIGCGLLLCGLYLAFFLSHTRIWLVTQTAPNGQIITLAGTTHKNKAAFTASFAKLDAHINQVIAQVNGDKP